MGRHHETSHRVSSLNVPATDFDDPTVPAALRRAVRLWPDHKFIVTPQRNLTFAAADEQSRRLSLRLLDAGVGKGTRVAFQYPNGVEWVVIWLAITRVGGVALPLSTSYTASELGTTLRHGDAAFLLTPAEVNRVDRFSFLEEAIPGLAAAAGDHPLRLPAVPSLRHIWVDSITSVPPWATTYSALANPAPTNVNEELLDSIESEVTPADWMIVIHTSGTTAEPKGVVHTHGSAVRHGANLARFNEMSAAGRNFCSMPFFWVGGVGVNLTTSLAIGSAVLCIERWDPSEALDLMARERATYVWMWGHHLRGFLDYVQSSGRDVSNIPFFEMIANSPPGDAGLRHNSLGMTETWGPHTAAGSEGSRVLPEELRGSFGLPVPGVEHRIVDPETGATLPPGEEGELCVRGYSLMAAMLKLERHEVFDDDGWLHTGDRGLFVDGTLIFRGRLDHMIKTSGANVAPREVEVALERHPDVAMAIVVGVPDAERGEVVGAVIVPRQAGGPTVSELEVHLGSEVSAFKIPRRWLFVDETDVPWLGSGKPDIRALAPLLRDQET